MNTCQRFALDHFLSDYPREMDYEKILDLIENKDEEIDIWDPFEHRNDLVHLIEHMVSDLKSKFTTFDEMVY